MAQSTTVTLSLSDEERRLVQQLIEERGFDTPEAALHALLQDAAQVYDDLWEKTFAESQDLLSQLAGEAHEEYVAGLTEVFDPDIDIENE